MIEKQATKPEIAAQKKVIKLPPAIGDWTTYKPPRVVVKKVKSGLYGFDRLSKEEINLFLQIHYRFLQDLAKDLKINLGMAVEIFSVNVEQTTYLNLLRTLSGPIVQGKIKIPKIHDTVQLVFALPVANSLINFALGSHDIEPLNRGLTEAENITLSTTLNEFLSHYAKAFDNIFANPSYSVVSSPDATIDNSINTSSTFVCFNAEIALGDNPPGKITIGYLGSTLKALLNRYKRKVDSKPLDFSILPASLLKLIKVPISIKLGNTTLTTNEINGLEDGDVVNLDKSIDNAFELIAGKSLKLLCQPGTKDKKLAVKVSASTESEKNLVPPPTLKEETQKPVAAKLALPKQEPVKKDTFDLDDDFLDDDFEDEDSEGDDLAEEDDFDDDDDDFLEKEK